MSRFSRYCLAHLTSVAITIWACMLTIVCSSLMVAHWVPLPSPAVGSTITQDSEWVMNRESVGASSHLKVTHFLYAGCPCSQKVLDHLLQRGALDCVNESVVLIGSPASEHLDSVSAKFQIEVVAPEHLMTKYGVESAPLLTVSDAHGVIIYSGGYTARKQGLDYQDQAIIRQLLAGASPKPLPVYGCAVSTRLKQMVDPLGLKN